MATDKYILKPDIRDQLLASHELMGALADKLDVDPQTIKRRLDKNLPNITEIASLIAIKEILGLPPEAIIYDILPVGKKTPQKKHV